MGFDQYHEPASDLSQEARTFARMIASLQEECEAIGWYQQRISIEQEASWRMHKKKSLCILLWILSFSCVELQRGVSLHKRYSSRAAIS